MTPYRTESERVCDLCGRRLVAWQFAEVDDPAMDCGGSCLGCISEIESRQPVFPLDSLGREWVPERLRQHWNPGNRRKGVHPHEKRSFGSVEEAQALADSLPQQPGRGMRVYECEVCGAFHIASGLRRGDPRSPSP